MTGRNRLARVLDELGATLLDHAHGPVADGGEITEVVIHDAADPPAARPGALVLGVGVHSEADLLAALAAHPGAAGIVVRVPVPATPAVHAAAGATVLVGFVKGASWAQLAAMVRALLGEGEVRSPATSIAGIPAGDLFAVANAIASLLDGPVTIEDRNSRVVAFSGRQDEADESRIATILGRQVPEVYAQTMIDRGVFTALYASTEPVFVAPTRAEPTGFAVPRLAIAVRAGEEILGSVWVAVRGEPSESRRRALSEAAKVVALHLLQVRAGSDTARRLRADLVTTALDGGATATAALRDLGLADRPVLVVALAAHPQQPADGPAARAEQARRSDSFAMHLDAVHPRSAAALVGDVTYALIPTGSEQHAARTVRDFLSRFASAVPLVAGVGSPTDVAGSRAAAERALRVLRHRSGGGPAVATLADVHVDTLLLDLRDLCDSRGTAVPGPLDALVDYDVAHHGRFVETLQAWLDTFGDVAAASRRVHVHPNTFRYRLRRAGEIARVDLDDSEVRFGLMLQLRMRPER